MRRAAAWFERTLVREGMPAELPAQPSWRRAGPRWRPVELPSDRDGGTWTLRDRAQHFLSDAQSAPGYSGLLEELYWRGDWSGYPKWHRQLLGAHLNDTTVAEFARARRLPYPQVWRALDEHKRRAGIGGATMGSGQLNGSIEKQASRVEQTQAVRVRAVFSEKLSPLLGLGHISHAEGELVMGGRFVRIEFPPDKPSAKVDHVLIPVGPGVSLAVLKD